MKTKPNHWTTLVLVFASCVIFSCTTQDNKKDLALAKAQAIIRADSIKWNNLFGIDDKSTKAMLDCPVDEEFVKICTLAFQDWYYKQPKPSQTTLKNNFTSAVAFKGDSLKLWLDDVGALNKGAEVRAVFGLYNKKALDHAVGKGYITPKELESMAKKTRLTVILRAFKNGALAKMPNSDKPLPSYNLGSLKP